MPELNNPWQIKDKKPIGKGGQGSAYLVENSESKETAVAKVLSGGNYQPDSSRWKRIEQEIAVSKSFEHPHVIRVLDSGHTKGSGFPYYVMPHYAGRSLAEHSRRVAPINLLKLFADICDGVAYVHSKGIVHRDLKPANVLLDEAGSPVIGDFGLCFRLDAESLTETYEVAAARWYGAPELRDGHLESPTPSADVYSLGKMVYWLFTGKVYDRDEEAYGIEERTLRVVLRDAINMETGVVDDRLLHAGAMVDDLIAATVRYKPENRIQNAEIVRNKTLQIIARLESGGRALDLRIEQRCQFCGNGAYVPLEKLPPLKERTAGYKPESFQGPDIYGKMRDRAKFEFGSKQGGVGAAGPLFLICTYCGHVLEFRLDLAPDSIKNWRP